MHYFLLFLECLFNKPCYTMHRAIDWHIGDFCFFSCWELQNILINKDIYLNIALMKCLCCQTFLSFTELLHWKSIDTIDRIKWCLAIPQNFKWLGDLLSNWGIHWVMGKRVGTTTAWSIWSKPLSAVGVDFLLESVTGGWMAGLIPYFCSFLS